MNKVLSTSFRRLLSQKVVSHRNFTSSPKPLGLDPPHIVAKTTEESNDSQYLKTLEEMEQKIAIIKPGDYDIIPPEFIEELLKKVEENSKHSIY